MARLNIAPTKSNFLSLKRQLAFAEEGYDLLEQKRQILIFELMSRLGRAREVERDIAELLRRAHAALREATLDIGSAALERAALGAKLDAELTLAGQHSMGLTIPRVTFRVRFARPALRRQRNVGEHRSGPAPVCGAAAAAGRAGGTAERRAAAGARAAQDPAPLQRAVENLHPGLPRNARLHCRHAGGTRTRVADDSKDYPEPSRATGRRNKPRMIPASRFALCRTGADDADLILTAACRAALPLTTDL